MEVKSSQDRERSRSKAVGGTIKARVNDRFPKHRPFRRPLDMSLRCCLLVLLAFAVSQVIGRRYPNPGKCLKWGPDHPCKCVKLNDTNQRNYDKFEVECEMNRTTKGVEEALQMMRGKFMEFERWYLKLKLKHPCMSLNELPDIVIRKTKYLKLSQCEIDGLEEPEPFEWPILYKAEFDSLKIMHSPWSLVKGPEFNVLVVKGFSMTHIIGQQVRQRLSGRSLYCFYLIDTGTHTIEPGSMTHLMVLMVFSLQNIPIKYLPRSALPKQLPWLHVFSVRETLLEKLEPSFFDGMPKLHIVELNGNKFTTLDSSWFTPIMKKLQSFYVFSNPLLCSCDLLWIQHREVITKGDWRANCYDSEENLHEIRDLKEEDYCKTKTVEVIIETEDHGENLQDAPMRLQNV